MQLWKNLYNTVWLAFFACLPFSLWIGAYIGLSIHILLGIFLLVMTIKNASHLAALEVPDRLKRISRITKGFAVFQLVSGLVLGSIRHLFPDLPFAAPILHGIHIAIALAILAQASSVATSYDMWEEKEYEVKPASSENE